MLRASKVDKVIKQRLNEDVIIERNGKLYIESGWETMYKEPTQYKSFWPTGILSKDNKDLIGKEVRYIGSGVYQIIGASGYPNKIELTNGTSTKPEFGETRPLKKPKNAKSWFQGKWVNY